MPGRAHHLMFAAEAFWEYTPLPKFAKGEICISAGFGLEQLMSADFNLDRILSGDWNHEHLKLGGWDTDTISTISFGKTVESFTAGETLQISLTGGFGLDQAVASGFDLAKEHSVEWGLELAKTGGWMENRSIPSSWSVDKNLVGGIPECS